VNERDEITAIERLKYRYIRCLDLKRWRELGECLTPDCTTAYGDGAYTFAGRARILEFLAEMLGPAHKISSHRVHQPEIELTGEATATGIWALDDVVIDTLEQETIRGAAIYSDTYVKTDVGWLISATGYERIWEETESRRDRPGLVLTANRWATR
jgi:hypothetical protein